jgi:hypothetical protein
MALTREEEVKQLDDALKTLVKWTHPSRLGRVLNESEQTFLEHSTLFLKLTASRIRADIKKNPAG